MSETYPPFPEPSVTVSVEPFPRPLPETGADLTGPLIGGSVLLMLAVAAFALARAFTKEDA